MMKTDMLNANKTEIGATLMALANIKQEAHHLIDQLPDGSTWNDAIYEMVVRREIELGLADSDANNTSSVESIRKEYNLD